MILFDDNAFFLVYCFLSQQNSLNYATTTIKSLCVQVANADKEVYPNKIAFLDFNFMKSEEDPVNITVFNPSKTTEQDPASKKVLPAFGKCMEVLICTLACK